MKKIYFLIAFVIITNSLAAQSYEIYIIYTSITDSGDKKNGLFGGSVGEFDPQKENYPKYIFIMDGNVETNEKYMFLFIHKNLKNQPDQPIIETKPKSFLNEIQYIDWDIIGPTLNKAQAEQKYQEITGYDKIYFIDRNDFTQDSIKIIQVKKLELAKY